MVTTGAIAKQVTTHRQFFQTGHTRSVEQRLLALKQLKLVITTREADILAALHQDFSKPEFEGYVNEVLSVMREIKLFEKQLRRWARPQPKIPDLIFWPATAQIYAEPLGVVLVISPWNYPFYLCLMPLIGAIAAGNCVVIKPSELTPATSGVIATLIAEVFPTDWVSVVLGDAQVSQTLVKQPFDHIFFTGSPGVGKQVMAAAADQLIPITLELGGKSPCIVDTDINLRETIKRISWGKFVNAGQTCVAPDYLLVPQSLLPQLLEGLMATTTAFFGEPGNLHTAYTRIISRSHWQRLVALLDAGEVVYGGRHDSRALYLSPTLMVNPDLSSPLMQDEIFGPILPILTYDHLDEAIAKVNARPKPLALYFFSRNRQKQQQILTQTSAGGVCINDTLMHLGVSSLPFGGVGQSGMGNYHGKASFECFSHRKSVLCRPFWGETNLRYPPYGHKMQWIKRLFS